MQGASVNGCAFCYDRNRDIFTFRIRGIQRGATQSNIHYLFLTYLTFPKGVTPIILSSPFWQNTAFDIAKQYRRTLLRWNESPSTIRQTG